MKNSISHILVLAVAGIAIGCMGCDLGTQRKQAARQRLEKRMIEARLTAAQELLAAGYVDQAQRVLAPYLPSLESETAANEPQVAQETTAEKQQFAKADLTTPVKQLW